MSLTNREVYEANINELKKLRIQNDFITKRYEHEISELEKRIEWLKQMNKGLIDLSMEVLRRTDDEK